MYDDDITEYFKCITRPVEYVHDHKAAIYIPKLYDLFRVIAYKDALVLSNADAYSQLKRIIVFTNVNNN